MAWSTRSPPHEHAPVGGVAGCGGGIGGLLPGRSTDRLQRLNEFGFAVDEVQIMTCPDGADLAGRLAPTGVLHEIREHRWFLSETVLRVAPQEVTSSVAVGLR